MYFTPFGRVLDLINDCIACAVDKLIADFGGLVWNETDFERLRDFIRENLNEVTGNAQALANLTLTFEINQRLKGKMDFTMAFAFADIKKHK